ncbi:hypothetical protein BU23DRAFT_159179 [Bimuria novae-zelandiae CBS 107.79]|uniref:Protein kinase domain-containing protein n=1 Tax=Bimuria novae-zelandiae CBS 107.79 TaxID=1447943 RepID=A0A6A5V4V4_9PLEO|nr:hypothetical protein BU23DRAFT_159179 [Bimuria novae-zelandiae CBS 107.79]
MGILNLTRVKPLMSASRADIARWLKMEDIVTFTEGAYKPISLAGSGESADVWLCVRPGTVRADGSATLYALKISSKRRRDTLEREVKALQLLKAVPDPVRHHF